MRKLLYILATLGILVIGCKDFFGTDHERRVIPRKRYYASAMQKPPYSVEDCRLGFRLFLHKAVKYNKYGPWEVIIGIGHKPPNFEDVARGDWQRWSWYRGTQYRAPADLLPSDEGIQMTTEGPWRYSEGDNRTKDPVKNEPISGYEFILHQYGKDSHGSWVELTIVTYG